MGLVEIAAACTTLLTALLMASDYDLEFDWQLGWLVLAVAWNGLLVGAAVESVRSFGRAGLTYQALAGPSGSRLFANRLLILPYLFFGVVGYARCVFPMIPQEFGGGKKPLVRLSMSTDADLNWLDGFTVTFSLSENKTIVGPATLILDTGEFFVISPASQQAPPLPVLPLPIERQASASVAVPKKSVGAVFYIARERRKQH